MLKALIIAIAVRESVLAKKADDLSIVKLKHGLTNGCLFYFENGIGQVFILLIPTDSDIQFMAGFIFLHCDLQIQQTFR